MIKRFGGNNYNYVIAVAGQSNAVGYDESPVDEKFLYNSVDSTRIKQLGFYGDENLKLIDLGHCAQNVQDMRGIKDVNGVAGTKGIHLPLANMMLDYIPQDYGIIVIPVAYGSTGFNSGNEGKYDELNKKPVNIANGMKWSATSALYLTLRDRIKHVLDLNPHNVFAGVVWIQGENDRSNPTTHKAGFEAMTQTLFDYMNSNGYGNRVPSGVWDRDIWYNVETVTYWDFQGQCKTIWNNYKTWNENTYVKIPRDTESNLVNGTGGTSDNYSSHYGNNAFQKVIAPRVLQKMIDMNTFPNKSKAVDNSKDNEEYINSLPEQRLVSETDVLIQKANDSFTITVAGGECDINQDLTAQIYANQKPLVYFGEVYKMEWKVTKGTYWLVIEGNDINDCVVLGVGRENTHQIARLIKGKLEVIVKGSSKYPNDRYDFHVNDRVRVYRNKDNTVSVYRTNAGNGVFQKWFDCEVPNYCTVKGFGFTFGIGVNEIASPFDTNKTKIFSELTIQEKEYEITNKLFDFVVSNLTGVNLTTDATPTRGSINPVQSGGVFDALETKVNTSDLDLMIKNFMFDIIFSENPNTGESVALSNGVTYDSIMEKINNGEVVTCNVIYRGNPVVGGSGGYQETKYRTNSCIISSNAITFTYMRYQMNALPPSLEFIEVVINSNNPTNATLTKRS